MEISQVRNMSIILAGFILVAVFGLTACNPEMLHAKAPVRIKDPWLRWDADTNTGELYFYLSNTSAVDDALLEAQSEAATEVDIYSAPPGSSITDIEKVSMIELPLEKSIILLPGGPHIKLLGMRDVTPGQLIPITLRFEHAGEFSFFVEAR